MPDEVHGACAETPDKRHNILRDGLHGVVAISRDRAGLIPAKRQGYRTIACVRKRRELVSEGPCIVREAMQT